MKKWLFGGLIGFSAAAMGYFLYQIKKTERQQMEFDQSFARAEMMLQQQEDFLRERILEQRTETDKTANEIKELVDEVNRLMADMGLDQQIMDIETI